MCIRDRLRKAEQPLQIRNRRGRVTETVAPPEDTVIGRRNEQYIDRTQSTPTPTPTTSTKTETPKSEDKKTKTPKKDNKKPKEELKSTKVIKKTEKKKKNDPLKIHGKNPSSIQKKLLKAGFTTKELEDLVTAYNEKYRNKRGW